MRTPREVCIPYLVGDGSLATSLKIASGRLPENAGHVEMRVLKVPFDARDPHHVALCRPSAQGQEPSR